MEFNKNIATQAWRKTAKLWEIRLENLCREFGATYVDRLIISSLGKSVKQNKKEIASVLCTESQSLTRSLSRLEEANLLSVSASEEDLRFQIYCLTGKGEELYHRIEAANSAVWDIAIKGVSEKELRSFQNVFSRMELNLERSK